MTSTYAKLLRFLTDQSPGDFPLADYFIHALEIHCGSQDAESAEQQAVSPPRACSPEHWRHCIQFIDSVIPSIAQELAQGSVDAMQELDSILNTSPSLQDARFRHLLWSIFCPEAAELEEVADNRRGREEAVRAKRIIRDIVPNPEPIQDPCAEILFTSNVLLTIPDISTIAELKLPTHLRKKLAKIAEEEQIYWYDHPMPVGIAAENSELFYGLRGLSEMLAWEKQHNKLDPDAQLRVLLSVSVTHRGLADIAKEYIHHEVQSIGSFPGLEIYIVTEEDTKRIAEFLARTSNLGEDAAKQIAAVFGVDGMYGRHYSFLKAAPPLWSCLDSKLKATFKIDLDQVFPQEELKAETGKSALEHFCTALWGARGTDADGKPVELGMIAGALVNQKDITQGLFTPDVNYPEEPLSAIDLLFPRSQMMASSTRAEMMTRYTEAPLDGLSSCLQRLHVTGGTNGILFESLRKHRPFTPSFIGRAEDQAYLMSAHEPKDAELPLLRYVHASGLIMRHDKSGFAGGAIQAAKLGTYAGDLLRSMVFSRYAECLPGGLAWFKREFAPFTSCFTSAYPLAASMARLMLHCRSMADEKKGLEQLYLASLALADAAQIDEHRRKISETYQQERKAWDMYYAALEQICTEADPSQRTEAIGILQDILRGCKITNIYPFSSIDK